MAIINLRRKKEIDIENKRKYFEDLSNAQYSSNSANNLRAITEHRSAVRDEIKNMEKQRLQLIEIEGVKLLKYNNARKEQKILEKLKEKQYDKYLIEIQKEEMKFLDELSINRFKNTDSKNRIL